MTTLTATTREQVAPRPDRRRTRAGRVMIAVAVLGLLTSVFGVVVGWRLVGQVERTVDDSLVLTSDALVTLDDTIVLADGIIASVASGLEVTEDALGTSSASFDTATAVIADLTVLTEVVAPSLADAADTLDRLAATGRIVDGFLGDVASIPFAPAYSGDLGGSLGDLAADLDPVATAVADAGEDLDALVRDADAVREDLEQLRDAIADVNAEIAGSERLLDRYRAQTAEAGALAIVARDDLASEVDLTRGFIVVAGILGALTQIVPLWIGLTLLGRIPDDPPERPQASPRSG